MSTYKEETKLMHQQKVEQLLDDELPSFCKLYYDARFIRLASKTQLDYASKMKIFLEFLHDNNSYFGKRPIKEYTIDDLALLTVRDFEEFSRWILKQKKHKNSKKHKDTNQKGTVENYMACLSSYFSFFVKEELLPKNPILAIERVKKQKRPIIYLQADDRGDFMNVVTTGIGLTKKQKAAWDKTKLRETCMMQLLMDTGIRISELVGLDISDVDLKHCMLSIERKGDKPDHAYFSDSTADLLTEYIEYRKTMYVQNKEEDALFLVSQGKYRGTRLSVRSVQVIVKKFAQSAHVTDAKKITPHKLRSTYAMSMLETTQNPAIVQQQLGHENISTTVLYASGTEDDKKKNRNNIF